MTVTESELTITGSKITARKIASTRSELKTFPIDPQNPSLLDSGFVSDLRISCKRCEIPLSGRDQFLGHLAISHEIPPVEAVAELEVLIRQMQEPYSAKERTSWFSALIVARGLPWRTMNCASSVIRRMGENSQGTFPETILGPNHALVVLECAASVLRSEPWHDIESGKKIGRLLFPSKRLII